MRCCSNAYSHYHGISYTNASEHLDKFGLSRYSYEEDHKRNNHPKLVETSPSLV